MLLKIIKRLFIEIPIFPFSLMLSIYATYRLTKVYSIDEIEKMPDDKLASEAHIKHYISNVYLIIFEYLVAALFYGSIIIYLLF